MDEDEEVKQAIEASLRLMKEEEETLAKALALSNNHKTEDTVITVELSMLGLALLVSSYQEELGQVMVECGVGLECGAMDAGFIVVTGGNAETVERAKKRLQALVEVALKRDHEEKMQMMQMECQIQREEEKKPPQQRNVSKPPSAPQQTSQVKRSRPSPCVKTVIIDVSNILIGAGKRRVNIASLCNVLEGDAGQVVKRMAMGSPVKGYNIPLQAVFESLGYICKGFESHSRGGKESMIDEALELALAKLVIELQANKGRGGSPVTVVLCTGDGNRDDIHAHRMGFPRMVTELLRSGAFVEVWSWKISCSNAFKKISSERYQLNYLDDVAHSIYEV